MIWFEIFKAGTQTDSRGNSREWSESDLDNIIRNTEASGVDIPLVYGHPKDNSPAMGWVDKVKREGNRLLARIKEIQPEMKTNIQKRLYPNRSISLRSDNTLRHIGFLGGVAPAVKGLGPINFSAGEEESNYSEYEFTATEQDFAAFAPQQTFAPTQQAPVQPQAQTQGNPMDQLINFIVDWLNRNVNPEIANSVKAEAIKFKATLQPQQAQQAPPQMPQQQPQAPQPQRQFSETEIELHKRNEELAKKLKDMEFKEFFESNVKSNKLTPAVKDTIRGIYDILNDDNAVHEYSEGDNVKSISGKDLLTQFMDMIPEGTNLFSEFANKDSSRESAESKHNKQIVEDVKHVMR